MRLYEKYSYKLKIAMSESGDSTPPMPKFLSDIYSKIKEGGKRKKTRKNKKRKFTRKMYRGGQVGSIRLD